MKTIKTSKWSESFNNWMSKMEKDNPKLLKHLDNMFCITDECLDKVREEQKTKKEDNTECECQHSMDMHCDGIDDGW